LPYRGTVTTAFATANGRSRIAKCGTLASARTRTRHGTAVVKGRTQASANTTRHARIVASHAAIDKVALDTSGIVASFQTGTAIATASSATTLSANKAMIPKASLVETSACSAYQPNGSHYS
jgi:hypothetical protein